MSQLMLFCLLAAAPLACLAQAGNETDSALPPEMEEMKRVSEEEKMVGGIMGVCEEAIACSKGLAVDEMYAMAKEGRQPDFDTFADMFCTMNTKGKEACLTQCPIQEGSVMAVFQSGTDYICDERLEDFKKAVQCAKKMTPETILAKCDNPGDMGQQWEQQMEGLVKAGTPLDKLADNVLGENGIMATMCGLSSCYLDAVEEHSEKVCGDRKHGKLLRDVLEVMWPKLQELVQSLHVDCLIPDKCKEMP